MSGWMIAFAACIPIIQLLMICFCDDGKIPIMFFACSIFGLAPVIFAESVVFFSIGIVFCVNFLAFFIAMLIAVAIESDGLISETTSQIIFVVLYLVVYVGLSIFIIEPAVENRRYENEVILIETPEVTEKRYELFTENDMENSDNIDFFSVIKICCEDVRSEDYYMIYYKIEDGNKIITVPVCIDESDIEIVPIKSGVEAGETEYFLEITEEYYKEDRNVEPYVVEYSHTEVKYELHLKESSIRRIPEITR